MKSHNLILFLCLSLASVLLAPPEVHAQARGLLLLDKPLQIAGFEYSFRNLELSPPNGSSSSSTLNKIQPFYYISVPFAVVDPDIFAGNVSGSVRYIQDFVSSSVGTANSNSSWNFNYGIRGSIMQKKPLSVSFYANSNQTWVQQEFQPGSDVTTTTYGGMADYRNKVFPTMLRYDHDENEYTTLSGKQNNNNDVVVLTTTNMYRDRLQSTLNVQYQSTRNSNGAFYPTSSLEGLNVNLVNSTAWSLGSNRTGSLSSSLLYGKTTGDSRLTSYQIMETVSQSLGKSLKSGASYSFSLQDSPLDSTRSQAANLFLDHRLYNSLRTHINVQGTVTQFPSGDQDQILGGVSLTYDKRLPRNSELQLGTSYSYQWNKQQTANPVRTQFNEQIKITDLASYYPLANSNVTRIVEVWNQARTIQYFSPADYGTTVFGDQTSLTINATGQIHTGDQLLVTYQYQNDTNLTIGANTVSFTGNLSLLGNFLRLFAQYTETQQNLLSGSAKYATLGSSSAWSVGAESNFTGNTLGIRFNSADNSRTTQDSIYTYWWYNWSLGRTSIKLSLSDNYGYWTEKGTGREEHVNSLGAVVTATSQFTRTSQGTLTAGYLLNRGRTNSENIYVSLSYILTLGKLQFWLNAQTLLNDYSGRSLMNNTMTLKVVRYFN